MQAFIGYKPHILEYLLQQFREEIDVLVVDDGGGNAYHYAAHMGKVYIMKKLLAINGSVVNAKSNRGWTPLHRAAFNGHMHMVEFLLDAGGDVDAVNRDGQTPDRMVDNDEINFLIRKHRNK